MWAESAASAEEEEGGEGGESSRRKEGRGLEPLMIQPRAKKESPARMAVPQAWEYHLLYCLMANLHCSRSVAGSGLFASGGFGKWTFWPGKLGLACLLLNSLEILELAGGGGGGVGVGVGVGGGLGLLGGSVMSGGLLVVWGGSLSQSLLAALLSLLCEAKYNVKFAVKECRSFLFATCPSPT